MEKQFQNIDDMKELITNEFSECEMDDGFNCEKCCNLEQCYHKSSTKSSHEFAESLDYGGYDTEEEFWENLD